MVANVERQLILEVNSILHLALYNLVVHSFQVLNRSVRRLRVRIFLVTHLDEVNLLLPDNLDEEAMR